MEQHDFDLNPQQWVTLRLLLDEGLALEPAQRATWLDGLAAPLADFKPRLRELLELAAGGPSSSHSQAHAHLRMLTLPKVETADFAPSPHEAMPERIGPYRLLRELGSGGMASVWLAERTDMLQGRQVALKLPHGDWGAYGVRSASRRNGLAERMAREREILATLNHPNIASLYDAGVADDGQPYLALEYVEGVRIDAYCKNHHLDVAARLRLFLQAARAVAHAHANLVVHRDLKPSNILVNAQGEVRLLDFGIAKLLDQGVAAETELTQQVGRALTPDYASPEQIRGEAIGTASDVYSLGVVLYELLTGVRPYKLERGSRAALEDAVLRTEPKRPSAVVGDKRLQRTLRGDLDTIVLNALKGGPRERYATADAFGNDVQRWIDGLTVLAQPDRPLYRWRKFVGRHRLAVGMVAALIAVITGGVAITVRQSSIAVAELRRTQQALAFVTSIFRDADPWKSAQRVPDPAGLLIRAADRLEREFPSEPLVRAELLTVIAEALVGLQREEAAEKAGTASLAIALRHAGADHPLAIRARLALAESHFFRDQLRPARAQLELALVAIDSDPARQEAQRLPALSLLAQLLVDEDRPEEGERAASAGLEWAERLPVRQPVREIELWRTRALAAQLRGDRTASVDAARRAFELASVHYRDDSSHPDLLDTQMRYGRVLSSTSRTAEGLAMMAGAVATATVADGPESRVLAIYLHRLAAAQADAGHIAAARESAQRAHGLIQMHYPAQGPMIAGVLQTLSRIEVAARRPDDARRHAEMALKVLDPGGDAHGVSVVTLRGHQALAMAQMGEVDAAVAMAQRVAVLAERHGPASRVAALLTLGTAQRLAGKTRDALATLHLAKSLSAQLPDHHREHAELLAELGQTQLALGEIDAGIESLAAANVALGETTTAVGAEIAVALARAHLGRGSVPEALAFARRANAFWLSEGVSGRWPAEAALWLARCHRALGQARAARGAYTRASAGLATSSFPGDTELLAQARKGS